MLKKAAFPKKIGGGITYATARFRVFGEKL